MESDGGLEDAATPKWDQSKSKRVTEACPRVNAEERQRGRRGDRGLALARRKDVLCLYLYLGEFVFLFFDTRGARVDHERASIARLCLSLQTSRWLDPIELLPRRLSPASLGHHVHESRGTETCLERGKEHVAFVCLFFSSFFFFVLLK